jgi:hypothetical protein
MQSQLGKKSSRTENVGLLFGVLVTVLLIILIHKMELRQKWETAAIGTVGSFEAVIVICRSRWKRLTFWTALLALFAVHLLAIWMFFRYAFSGQNFGFVWWTPIGMIEAACLVVAAKRIEEIITGKHETYKEP